MPHGREKQTNTGHLKYPSWLIVSPPAALAAQKSLLKNQQI